MGPKEVIANLNRRVRLPDGYEGRFTGATIRKDESGRVFYQAELQVDRAAVGADLQIV